MGSSRRTGSKILGVIEPARAEAFLLKLANTHPLNDAVAEKLSLSYPEMAQPCGGRLSLETLTWAQAYLQRAWRAPNDRHREWYLHEMRRQYREAVVMTGFREMKAQPPVVFSLAPGFGTSVQQVDPRLIEPPAVTPFEAAVFYLQSRIGDRAKYCGHQDCPAPYFIAIKRWQKFCSEKCAGPANRESKRKWWHENREGRKK